MADEPPHQGQENRDEEVKSENHHSQSAGEQTDAPANEDSPLSPSVVFGLLADERRRYVLYYLDVQDGHAEFEALAKQVAAWEHDTSTELLTEDTIKRVSTGLYHTDLPKLADHGLIGDEFHRGTITLTETAAQVTHYVDYARQFDDVRLLGESNLEQSETEREGDG